MFKIPYQIIISTRALFLLSNLYHAKKDDMLVLKKVVATLDEFREKPWNRSYEEYKKLLDDEGEANTGIGEEALFYHKNHENTRLKKIALIKEKGFYYEHVPPLHIYHATEINNLKTIGNNDGFSSAEIKNLLYTNLHGLTGGVVHFTNSKRNFFEKLYVPFQISNQVQECYNKDLNEDGSVNFESSISSNSLQVLKYIFEKTTQLRNKYGKGWFPFITDTEIQRKVGISKTQARQSTKDLVGVISEVLNPIGWGKYRYHRLTFLPSCRQELAEEILMQYK